MKRRNFLKAILAAPAIPLVGKAIAEAEPIYMPYNTVVDDVHTIDAFTEVPRLDIYSQRRHTLFQTFDQSLYPGDIVGISDGGFAKRYELTDRSGPVGVVVADKGHPDGMCLVAMDEQVIKEWNND